MRRSRIDVSATWHCLLLVLVESAIAQQPAVAQSAATESPEALTPQAIIARLQCRDERMRQLRFEAIYTNSYVPLTDTRFTAWTGLAGNDRSETRRETT